LASGAATWTSGARFDLKHADGIGLLNHRVPLGSSRGMLARSGVYHANGYTDQRGGLQ
jgi:hypothetical protein